MGGHLFIVHGDLTQLCCDAWLLPCDFAASPSPSWLKSFASLPAPPRLPAATQEWRNNRRRAMKVDEWSDKLPRPWLVNVGATIDTEVSWFVAGAEEFIRHAADDLRQTQGSPRNGRAKHLLALPVVGTGQGGAHRTTGDVVRELVPALQRLADAHDVDIALVSNDELTFAAAQAQRGTARSAWNELDDTLWTKGEELAQIAAKGDLVLFIGAGVSQNAGLPNWG